MKRNQLFYITGTLFHIAATLYFLVLIWKSYVWWQWLHRLQDTLEAQPNGLFI